MRSPLQYTAALVAIAVLYFAAAKLGLSMAVTAEQVTLVWPPSGIALAAVLLFGYRIWPAIALGAFLANATTPNETFATASGIAIGNTLEALCGALLLHWLIQFRTSLDRVRDVLGLVVLAALLSTMVSATIGVATMCLTEVHPWTEFADLWWVWWLGDATGVLIVAPLILSWSTARHETWTTWRILEAAGSVVALVATCVVVFKARPPTLANRPLEYIIFPFVIWAALRFGQRGATLVTAVSSAIAIAGTIHGFGPFSDGRGGESLELLQSFMGMVAITGLILAAVLNERQTAEDAREQLLEALKAADRRKDEFLAVLAHELRNPLAPIVNALELLRLTRNEPGAFDRPVRIMQRQLNQMVRLIDDLLDVSRITRNKLELRKELVGLSTIVQNSLEISGPQLEQSGNKVSLEFPPEPMLLHADPTRLAQTFSNLLNNAAKYSKKGSSILVAAERHGEEVIVRVCDEGIGIAPEMLAGIFEMFTQLDRSTYQRQGGLGIGLTLARQLVEMHGGTIEARSAGPGKGSQFVVRLPLSNEPGNLEPHPSESGSQPHAFTRRRILVVDDNPDTADSLAMVLLVLGHDVRTAHDGRAAVEAAETFRPEIVFLDIGMPELNGYEVASRIRALDGGDKIVLIAVSGWGKEEDKRRSKETGFDDHVIKPLDPICLRRLIAELK